MSEEQEKRLQEAYGEVENLLKPMLKATATTCKYHPKQVAALTCASCGCGLCWNCIREVANPARITCPECKSASVKKKTLLAAFTALKFPGLWVAVCILISGITYACGIGNPTPEQYAKADADIPWYRQRAGKLYLEKAARERQRGAMLKHHKHKNEAVIWYLRAADSFASSAKYWQNAPILKDLTVAGAMMLEEGDKPEEAIKKLNSIKVTNKDKVAAVYYYTRARIEEKLGNKAAAMKSYDAAHGACQAGRGSFMNKFIDRHTKNKWESDFLTKAAQVCGVEIPVSEIDAKCCEKLGLESDGFGGYSSKKKVNEQMKKWRKLAENFKKKVDGVPAPPPSSGTSSNNGIGFTVEIISTTD